MTRFIKIFRDGELQATFRYGCDAGSFPGLGNAGTTAKIGRVTVWRGGQEDFCPWNQPDDLSDLVWERYNRAVDHR